MTLTQKLAALSAALSDGYKFVKLRQIIEYAEKDRGANQEALVRIDYAIDILLALANKVD